jgi:hypothetical protein
LVTAVDEESEADEQVDGKESRKKKSAGNKKKVEKQYHSPSVAPKECADNDVSNTHIRVSSRVDGTNDEDEDESPKTLSTTTRKTDMDSKETGTGRRYYCNLCAAGGWEKQVSLPQHMRHMHKAEYDATIEVSLKKRRWTHDEMFI